MPDGIGYSKKPSRFQRFTNRLIDPGNLTDANVQRNQEMADLLLQQASNPKVGHKTQGYAALMKALNSQIYRKRAEKGESALKEQRAAELGQLMESLGGDFSPATMQALQGAGNNPVLASIAPALLGNDQAIANREDTQAFQSGEAEAERLAKANIKSTDSYFATANRAYPELGVNKGQEVRLAEQTMPNGQVQVGLVLPDGTLAPVNSADFASPTSKVTDPNALSASGQNAQIKALEDATILGAQLANVGQFNSEEFLTMPARIKARLLRLGQNWKANLNEEQRTFVWREQAFRSGVEQIFAGIRKQVTGAQAAMVEIDYLRESFISGDMTPSQFDAAFDVINSTNDMRVQIHTNLLKEGIDGILDPALYRQEMAERLNKAFNERFPSGAYSLVLGGKDPRAIEGKRFNVNDSSTWSTDYLARFGMAGRQ